MMHFAAAFGGAIALGFAVAAPIGPTGATAIRFGLSRGAPTAFWIGMGAAVTDLAYVLATYLGLVPLLRETPWLPFVLYVVGTYVLGSMGLAAVKAAIAGRRLRVGGLPAAVAPRKTRELAAGWGPAFLRGLSITIVNPATITSWLSLGGAFVAANLTSVPVPVAFGILAGIMVGSAGWFTILACLVGIARAAAARVPLILDMVGLASGTILLGFAVVFASQAVRIAV